MQQLMSYMRCAMEKYNMIDDGDKVAIGVSGGKDSSYACWSCSVA